MVAELRFKGSMAVAELLPERSRRAVEVRRLNVYVFFRFLCVFYKIHFRLKSVLCKKHF